MEDRFITAHHRNMSFLAEHFQSPYTPMAPATFPGGDRSKFAQRVQDMKARLHERDAASAAAGGGSGSSPQRLAPAHGVLHPALGSHPFFANDFPVRFDNRDDGDGPWLGDAIDNSCVTYH